MAGRCCRCSTSDLRVEFPTRRGTLRRGRRRLLRHRAGRGAGRRRRIRRRQVADRRGDHRPDRPAGPHRRRRDPARRPAHRQPAARGDAPHPRPRDRRGLPGSADLAQSAVHDRPAADRDDPHASADCREAQARARAIDLLDEVGIPAAAAAHRSLSAPVLRRHAPARGDRAGARREAASSSSPTSRRPRSTCRSRRRSSRC